jgi:hypothetical protein
MEPKNRLLFSVFLLSAALLAFAVFLVRLTSILLYPVATYLVIRLALPGYGISGSALALRKAGRPPSPKVIAAGAAVEKFLALNIARDWKAVGEGESHPGTEIEDFIRVLWQPLKESGEFEFGVERTGGRVVFNVTRCPIHNLARKTGLRDWPFHLACATDFYTTPAFCPRIGFTRTKTLIAGDDCRNHTYCCR